MNKSDTNIVVVELAEDGAMFTWPPIAKEGPIYLYCRHLPPHPELGVRSSAKLIQCIDLIEELLAEYFIY